MPLKHMRIPKWLDDLIFKALGGSYAPVHGKMIVKTWDMKRVLEYLGTYFPRSFSEAIYIFGEYFSSHQDELKEQTSLSVFDIGCGTGGELVGLVMAVKNCLPNVTRINIRAHDGNKHNLVVCEKILKQLAKVVGLEIVYSLHNIDVEDVADIELIDEIVKDRYDLVLSFKVVNEIVAGGRFGAVNPYACILKTFLRKLRCNGMLCVLDVAIKDEQSQTWLASMLDEGVRQCQAQVIARNKSQYFDVFYVTHSHKSADVSKVVWRILKEGSNEKRLDD